MARGVSFAFARRAAVTAKVVAPPPTTSTAAAIAAAFSQGTRLVAVIATPWRAS